MKRIFVVFLIFFFVLVLFFVFFFLFHSTGETNKPSLPVPPVPVFVPSLESPSSLSFSSNLNSQSVYSVESLPVFQIRPFSVSEILSNTPSFFGFSNEGTELSPGFFVWEKNGSSLSINTKEGQISFVSKSSPLSVLASPTASRMFVESWLSSFPLKHPLVTFQMEKFYLLEQSGSVYNQAVSEKNATAIEFLYQPIVGGLPVYSPSFKGPVLKIVATNNFIVSFSYFLLPKIEGSTQEKTINAAAAQRSLLENNGVLLSVNSQQRENYDSLIDFSSFEFSRVFPALIWIQNDSVFRPAYVFSGQTEGKLIDFGVFALSSPEP